MKKHKLLETFNMFRKLNISSILPGVTQGEFCVLKAIKLSNDGRSLGNVRISELAEKLELAPPSVSRTLNVLENRNLIEKIVDNEDRRNINIKLTDEGNVLLERIEDVLEDFAEAVTSQMEEEELEKLNEYFIKLYYISKQELELRKIYTRRNDK